jgi:hypothetical protein
MGVRTDPTNPEVYGWLDGTMDEAELKALEAAAKLENCEVVYPSKGNKLGVVRRRLCEKELSKVD